MRGADRIRIDIDRCGWHCVHVLPENDCQVQFTYTIGLSEKFRAPEVMVFGFPRERAHELLGVCAYLVANGEEIEVDIPDGRILQGGYKVVFREVSKVAFGEYLGTACRFFKGDTFRAVVLFVPDAQARYPWESGYNYIQVNEALGILCEGAVN